MIPVYLSHPLAASTSLARARNIRAAKRWLAWLVPRYDCAPIATWIMLADAWAAGKALDPIGVATVPPVRRPLGLAIDRELARLAGTVVMVGPSISAGMTLEALEAHTVVDLTGYAGPPTPSEYDRIDAYDRALADAGILRRIR